VTIQVTHATVAVGTDAGNGEIRKSHWNADHVILGAADLDAANTFTTDQKISSGSSQALLTLEANDAVAKTVLFATAGKNRWIITSNNAGESTDNSNTGSNFLINRYRDTDGAYVSTPLQIGRDTGRTTLELLTVPSIDLGSTDTTLTRLAKNALGVEGKSVPYVFAQSGTAASVGAVVTETTLATISFSGGEIGPNGWIQVYTTWTLNNNANNKNCRIRVGGAAGTMMMDGNPVSNVFFFKPVLIMNSGATGSQKTQTAAGNLTGTGTGVSAPPTASVGTSSAWDLVITGQKANSADTLTLEAYQVIVCYGA
jgi:hypothetical protein